MVDEFGKSAVINGSKIQRKVTKKMEATMTARPMGFFRGFWDRLRKFFSPTVLAVLTIDILMAINGHLLMVAALAGIAAVMSFVFVLMGVSNPSTKKMVITFLARQGVWLDLLVTVGLAYMGFSLGVTMGLTAMMIGFNLSAMISMCRWIDQFIYN